MVEPLRGSTMPEKRAREIEVATGTFRSAGYSRTERALA